MPDSSPPEERPAETGTPRPHVDSAQTGDGAVMRRLHPATILIEVLRRIGSFAYIVLIALLADFLGERRGSDWTEVAILGVLVLGAAGAVLRYVSVRFGIGNQRLVIRSGILNRQVRTIPLDRIQNIDLRRGILHRALRVVDVSIETAAGGRAEAELSALSEAEAERLKAELLETRQQAAGTSPEAEAHKTPTEADEGEVIWRASLSDLLLAGATENRAGVIVAGLAGLWYTFGAALQGRFAEQFQRTYESWLGAGGRGTAFLIIAGITLLIVAGWLVSIVLAVVRYYGFVLRRRGNDLRRRYGLFTQFETVLPLGRIQLLRIQAPWPRRLLRCCSVYVETAASVLEAEGGGSAALSPLVRWRRLPALCREVFPELDLEQVKWNSVSRLTIRRGMIRYTVAGLIVLGLASLYLHGYALWGLPVVFILARGAAYARFRALGYAEQGQFVLARAGVWTRRIWVVPHSKVQFVSVSQSPFQRRLKLANLEVQTAGSRVIKEARVIDLPAAEAEALQDALADRANAYGAWQPEGV